MCVVDIPCCDGNGTVFPIVTQMPSSTKVEVWKSPIWQGKVHTGMVKPLEQSIACCSCLFFHLFQSCSSNELTIWWTREGSEGWFCWGSSQQLSSPDDKCCIVCSGGSGIWSATCGLTATRHYAHGWGHPRCWGCCSALSAWRNEPQSCQNRVTNKGGNNEINGKEKNPKTYQISTSKNQVINGLWAALL